MSTNGSLSTPAQAGSTSYEEQQTPQVPVDKVKSAVHGPRKRPVPHINAASLFMLVLTPVSAAN